MAYTRGAMQRKPPAFDYSGDGELVVATPQPAPVIMKTVGPSHYICDRTTVTRDMEAYDLFMLMDKVLGGIRAELTPEEYSAASGDLRRHFKPVMAAKED
jgi:hypothetical protein